MTCLWTYSDALATTVIPLVVKYCHQAFSKQDETLTGISEHFGRLCQGFSGQCTAHMGYRQAGE